ncbi:DUF6338 family protein [Rhodococcus erythropolis]|uniref:Uncharacterized protein n=1 Tax=Rhodococcus erythropolis TaxID=1833 RepID=A0A8I0ZT58_RHOER|nr:DUF6338 family protein [Rhodococcus erythropolis]MBH5141864.1 hypothetical protein [Rhodococcus erythropolis]
MTLPQTLFRVVAILLLVVPGIIFTATRRFLRGLGADEKDFSVRLIHAIAASVIFDCLYLIVAGPWLVSLIAGASSPMQSAVLARPRISGLTVLILAVVIPALAAVLAHVRFRKRWYPFTFAERRHSTPTAWDYAATQADCYVRIYTSDGKWVGGYMPDKKVSSQRTRSLATSTSLNNGKCLPLESFSLTSKAHWEFTFRSRERNELNGWRLRPLQMIRQAAEGSGCLGGSGLPATAARWWWRCVDDG